MTKEEKEAAKKEKKELEEKYGFAVVDGRKEKVGNFRVEPPGLFRGRGAHPKAGCLKVNSSGCQVCGGNSDSIFGIRSNACVRSKSPSTLRREPRCRNHLRVINGARLCTTTP